MGLVQRDGGREVGSPVCGKERKGREMIRIQQLKLPVNHTEQQLLQKIAKTLRIQPGDILDFQIRKQSIDARKKREVSYVYTVDARVEKESAVLRRAKSRQVCLAADVPYQFQVKGEKALPHPPVIVGSGPAGLFCAYLLAEHGYCPVILERGKAVEERLQDVERFWQENQLDVRSNVQFGEGGAGTFSDGKLNTLVKDVKGRNRKVLEIFIRHGAPASIAWQNKPHIGTDILKDVIADMRRQIQEWGGTYLFETCMTGLDLDGGRLSAVTCVRKGGKNPGDVQGCKLKGGKNPGDVQGSKPEGCQEGYGFQLEAEVAVLAIGHSARDTFEMLLEKGFEMKAKTVAVGLRVEHPQAMVDEAQYGSEAAALLPAASYKLTANLENGRSVYSFCMCPGGFVVNASSEEGRVAVNGMSYSKREGANANSAIIVSVTPEDFGDASPLSGVMFQRRLEEAAYRLGDGCVPQQLFGDFEKGIQSEGYGTFGLGEGNARFSSAIKGRHAFAPLHRLFPKEITESFLQGMHLFANHIPGFDHPDVILSGVESRTSSPVRIPRGEDFECSQKGVYPCGEGAGYAGGIMSAAMDGMKVAEAIAAKYKRIGRPK